MTHMKKSMYFLLLMLAISSCTQVLFMQPIPIEAQALDRIPESLTGTFKVSKEKDTITIFPEGIRMGQEEAMKLNGQENGDIILKPYGKGYVANVLEDSAYQLVYLVPKGKNTLLVYMPEFNDEKKLAYYARMASRIIPKEGTKEPEKYLVQPGPGIMDEIIKRKLLSKPTKLKRLGK